MKKEILIGNMTTIVNTIVLAVAGLIIGVLSANGINLPIDQTSLAGVLGVIVFTIFGIINAKYHNTYFDDDTDTLTVNVDGLTDNQISAIQNFVDNIQEKYVFNVGGKDYSKLNDAQIEDIDPAFDYEDDGNGS